MRNTILSERVKPIDSISDGDAGIANNNNVEKKNVCEFYLILT